MIHYYRLFSRGPETVSRKMEQRSGRITLFICDFTDAVRHSLRGIVRGPSEAGLSEALLQSFQQVDSWAIHPSARLLNFGSVRTGGWE
jgi:hypothetical protein